MPYFNKTKFSSAAFVKFKPARLSVGKEWLVVFYCANPQTGKLQRLRNRVPPMPNKKNRLAYAQQMVDALNEKLLSGWSPFLEDKNHEIKTIDFCVDFFFKMLKREVADGIKRPATLTNYKSVIGAFTSFLNKKYPSVQFLVEITPKILNHFLDEIYLEQGKKASSLNFYLKNLKSFFNFCVSKGYLSSSPAGNIKTKPKEAKIRVVLNAKEKERIKTLREINHPFYTVCMCLYYCLIRPKELRLLKVGDVNLEKGYITVRGDISKNKKTENVTIPNVFLIDIQEHIKNAPKDYYLFGKGCLPSVQVSKSMQYMWEKYRKMLKIRKEVQFYSLKDTGITDLLNSGVPAIKVRDQARHSDLKITQAYTTRNNNIDDVIQHAGVRF